ncbi:hypothetical protein CSQ92_27690 [Janthinobacterium sp. BJB446]|uniref:hypothetical protein n=1 Tax=Janthinobacterium sp. BJB446 TaxID=2048009 RepID=UPI000C0D3695|nr:hypothetical protein [Janthinobacterium sp. BJB446]PHV19160.1 hypothetical protein CSQ92_27690 [Janthinobacterium sp. BJB446]
MKKKIYGRKVGSTDEMVLLIEGEGVSTGSVKIEQDKLNQFSVENARLAVQGMRERGIEGYVLFEGDPTHYQFTPESDFVYPAIVHLQNYANHPSM